MDIADLLGLEDVYTDLGVTSKKQALQALARHAAGRVALPERAIFDVLQERERLGSTGVGGGVAIPHGKMDSLDRLYGAFARLERPVNFEAVDDEPVDLVFLLLAPEEAGAEHLKALARVSRLLRDATVCEKLRGAEDNETVYNILVNGPSSRAA